MRLQFLLRERTRTTRKAISAITPLNGPEVLSRSRTYDKVDYRSSLIRSCKNERGIASAPEIFEDNLHANTQIKIEIFLNFKTEVIRLRRRLRDSKMVYTYIIMLLLLKEFWKRATRSANRKNLAKQQVFPLLSAASIPVFILIIWINLVIELLNCNIIKAITSRSPPVKVTNNSATTLNTSRPKGKQ